MKKIFLVLSIVFLSSPSFIFAATTDQVIWGESRFSGVPVPAVLKNKLEKEIQKVVTAGHLQPRYALYGEYFPKYFYTDTYDSVYAMALAYPYVSSGLQNQIKTFVNNELSKYPVWSTTSLPKDAGTRRDAQVLPESLKGAMDGYGKSPKLFGLYALWLYAQNTGDWTAVTSNWVSIKSFYSSNSSEVGQHLSGMSGGIGMARMAKKMNDTSLANSVASTVSGALSGLNMTNNARNTENIYKWADWTYIVQETWPGFYLMNLTPEVGRFISENSTHKNFVLNDAYFGTGRGEEVYSSWWLSYGTGFSRYFHEASQNPDNIRAMFFPVKAFVEQKNKDDLAYFADETLPIIGDFYFIQNLSYAIASYGTRCWYDIQNSSPASCVNSLSGSPAPTTAPAPTTSVPGATATSVPIVATATPASAQPTVSPVGNLMVNGDFENGNVPWIELDDVQARPNGYAFEGRTLSAKSGNFFGQLTPEGWISQYFNVNGNTSYSVTGWVRIDKEIKPFDAAWNSIKVHVQDQAYADIGTAVEYRPGQNINIGEDWRQFNISFTTPSFSGERRYQFMIQDQNAHTGNGLYTFSADNIRIEKKVLGDSTVAENRGLLDMIISVLKSIF